MSKITNGQKAPTFSVNDNNGNLVKLSDFEGKNLVLYFYPKDDTPGCTKEACSFRDSFSEFRNKNIEILGVSRDDEKSHKKFIEKYKLPFRLLTDNNGIICKMYGVLTERSMYGRKYKSINRTTFLIDKTGKIKHVFEKVKLEEHAREILELFKN